MTERASFIFALGSLVSMDSHRLWARAMGINEDATTVPQLVKDLFGKLLGDKGYFMGHLLAGLIAYTWRPTKPSLGIRADEMSLPVTIL